MIATVLRYAKRFAVLLPALVVVYVSIFNIFPWLNTHLPLIAALLITYLLGAYILIPAIIRLARVLFPAKHLPLYCVTTDGFASDPLNIAIIGTREQVQDAMESIGWSEADRMTPKTVVRMALSVIYKWKYPNAPMSNLYLFGRRQDLAFQFAIDKTGTESRHHVRFWAATYKDTKKLSVRSINWQHRDAHVQNDKLLWLGAASRDVGITFIRHNIQFTHLVDPDTDAERDLLAHKLHVSGKANLHRTIKLSEPYKILNVHALRGHLNTDAQMKIMEIKPKAQKRGSNQG